MRAFLCLLIVLFGLATAVWSGDQSRSYSFTAEATKADCVLLPHPSFEVMPSLARSKSDDRLTISCKPIGNENYVLTLTFSLTDAPPALARGDSRTYHFRWGEKIGGTHSAQSEFARNEERCKRVLSLLQRALPSDPNLGPTWSAECAPEDRWGTVLEFALTEASK